MTAKEIAQALGGCRHGTEWIVRCPAHDDRKPSLSVCQANDGKVLVHCHAGCDQMTVIAALRMLGLWGFKKQDGGRPKSSIQATKLTAQDEDARTRAALRLWEAANDAGASLAECYLASRRIFLPIPDVLRFHPALKHPAGQRWPAMLALVRRGADDAPMAVHRTFLARDGAGKAPVEPAKMMLGPCRGGAVRLGPVGEHLMIAEGIETALSAMQATGQPAWAALSTSGLRALDLPTHVREVIVLADGDDAGEAASQAAAQRWKREGRCVRIARPPWGLDFNDVLVAIR